MSQKIGTFEQSSPHGEAKNWARVKLLILIICWFVLLLIVVAMYASALVWRPTAERMTTDPSLAASHELMVARRSMSPAARDLDASFLPANPEIEEFQRHTRSISRPADAELYSRNPELRVFHRCIAERSGN